MSDPLMRNRYKLAERLHVMLNVIDDMSMSEYHGWLAHFELSKRENERGRRNRR